MGHFQVPARLAGPTARSEEAELFVDTGATLIILPRWLAERLELIVTRRAPVLLAGGSEEMWPIAEVRVAIDDQEVPTLCFIAPDGPALLGAVALESLSSWSIPSGNVSFRPQAAPSYRKTLPVSGPRQRGHCAHGRHRGGRFAPPSARGTRRGRAEGTEVMPGLRA